MNEMTSMTIRAQVDECERFKDLSRKKNISQGDLLKELMDIEEQVNEKTVNKGIEVLDDSNIRILLKENNTIKNNEKEAKIYSFKGRVVTWLQIPRRFYDFSYNTMLDELGFDSMQEKYNTNYQFYIYKMEGQMKYLVYEYLDVIDKFKNLAVAVIRRAKFANNLKEILNYLGPYISVGEAEMIEFALAEDISANSELIKEYIK